MNEVQGNQAAPQPSNNLQFNSATTQPKSARQIDPFAEQNAKAAEKKKQDSKKRKIIFIILGIILTLATIGGIVWLVMMLANQKSNNPGPDYTPEIAGSSEEDILNYQNSLQQYYDQKRDETPSQNINNPQTDQELIDSINQIVQNTLNTQNGQNNANAVLSAQTYFYYNNGYYQEAVNLLSRIDSDSLDNTLKSNLYEAAANSYSVLNDNENAKKYYNLLLSIPVEGMIYGN